MTASASRLLQFAWLSHANDIRFAANGYLTLQARASSTLRGLDRRPRVGRTDHHQRPAEGRLARRRAGDRPGPRGGSKRYETFADTTTSTQRALQGPLPLPLAPARAGHSFVFRARIRPAAKFPYETGYSQTVTVKVPLRSRLPPVYGHGRRER